MTEPWKAYLIFVGVTLLALTFIYFFAGLLIFKIILTLLVVFIWPFYAVYAYLLVKRGTENEEVASK